MSEDLLDEDELDPEEAERRITQFVISADELPGPPVEERADQVAALMRAASRDLETIMDGMAHNKVLATQLLLGQRARRRQPHDPKQWHLYAASTLLMMSSLRTINCSWSLQPHSCVTTCQALLGKCVLRSSRGVVALKAGLIAPNIEAAEQIRTN